MKATTTNNHNNIDDEDDNNGGRSRAGKRANGNEIGSDNSNKRFKCNIIIFAVDNFF